MQRMIWIVTVLDVQMGITIERVKKTSHNHFADNKTHFSNSLCIFCELVVVNIRKKGNAEDQVWHKYLLDWIMMPTAAGFTIQKKMGWSRHRYDSAQEDLCQQAIKCKCNINTARDINSKCGSPLFFTLTTQARLKSMQLKDLGG